MDLRRFQKIWARSSWKTFLEFIGICTDSVLLWFEIFADSKKFCWFLVIWEYCLKFENCVHPLVCSSKTLYELLNTWCFCIFILNPTRVSTKKPQNYGEVNSYYYRITVWKIIYIWYKVHNIYCSECNETMDKSHKKFCSTTVNKGIHSIGIYRCEYRVISHDRFQKYSQHET